MKPPKRWDYDQLMHGLAPKRKKPKPAVKVMPGDYYSSAAGLWYYGDANSNWTAVDSTTVTWVTGEYIDGWGNHVKWGHTGEYVEVNGAGYYKAPMSIGYSLLDPRMWDGTDPNVGGPIEPWFKEYTLYEPYAA